MADQSFHQRTARLPRPQSRSRRRILMTRDKVIAPLPTDPADFFRAGPDLDVLEVGGDVPSVLERLGPSPFPKSKFPFLGFLATVYDHVASHARNRSNE